MGLSVYIRRALENNKVIFPGKYCQHCTDHDKAKNLTHGRLIKCQQCKKEVYTLSKLTEMPRCLNHKVKCLECLRNSKTAHSYSSQYMNDPIDADSVEFKTEYLIKEPFTPMEVQLLSQTPGILSIDPAFGQKTVNDYVGLCVSKILPGNHVYVLEAIQQRMTVPALITKIFELRQLYNTTKVLLETTSSQFILLTPLKTEMVKRKDFFQIEEVGRSTLETKALRIRGLIPFYANGFVHHRPGLNDLEYQMIQFPRNTHDDIIDALAHQVPHWRGGHTKKQVVNNSPHGSLNWWKKNHGKGNKGRWDKLFGDLLK